MKKDTLKEIIKEIDACVALKQSGLSKEEVKTLADQGDLDAQLVLLVGLVSPDMEFYTEEFEDEDTHEVVQWPRAKLLDNMLFEAEPGEVEELSKKIEALIPSQSDETLNHWFAVFYQEALYPAITEELARRGDYNHLARIGDFYAEGFESAGYEKDKEKAREYYNKALAAGWDEEEYKNAIYLLDYDPLDHPKDLADDFDPRESIIMISGHPLYLEQIGYMVEDLTKAHGTPGNEYGLFVPLEFVFEALGFKWVHNTGNLMRFKRHNEPVLTLEIEANRHVDEALVEAFQKAYPKLTVEVVDNSPGI